MCKAVNWERLGVDPADAAECGSPGVARWAARVCDKPADETWRLAEHSLRRCEPLGRVPPGEAADTTSVFMS
jgi:hypothetical protein